MPAVLVTGRAVRFLYWWWSLPSPVHILLTHGGMARSWTGWLVWIRRQNTRQRSSISILTRLNVE